MPRPRPDLVFVPKVSWTVRSAPTAVSYGALVGTPDHIILLPRSGTETAGFTLRLQWIEGGVTADDIAAFVADPARSVAEIESTLTGSLPDWPGRCVFPIAQLSRFEIFRGWKLWLGVSAALQVGDESPTAVRVPNKSHLAEMRAMYSRD